MVCLEKSSYFIKKTFWKVFFLTFLAPHILYAEGILADRVLMTVDSATYTQRDVEIYFIVKALTQADETLLVSEKNWKASIWKFKEDMLLYEEALRTNLQRDDEVSFREEVQTLFADLQKSKVFKKDIERLLIDKKSFEKTFLILKKTKHQSSDSKKVSGSMRFLPKHRQLPVLDKAYFVHFKEDAFEYKKIHPSYFKESL